MDFSSILSTSSAINDINRKIESSIQSLTLNPANSTAITPNTSSSDVKIKLDNIDYNLVNYLNKEFAELGLESLHMNSSSHLDYNLLFKNAIELVKRFTRQQGAVDRLQEQ